MKYSKVIITTDGSCGPSNPGRMRMGLVVQGSEGPGKDAPVIGVISRDLNWGTSNEAEYRCILEGLNWAIEYGASECVVFTDSQLCERQINGGYAVKNKKLRAIHSKILEAASKCGAVVRWHRRTDGLGPIADALAKGGKKSEQVFQKLITEIDPKMEQV